MSRQTKKTIVQVKLEAEYGVNPGNFGGLDAVLVSNPKFSIDRDVRPRELVRPYLGAAEEMQGARRARLEFDVEAAGSGAAGTAPAWGKLLRGCGMSETITAGTLVEYAPVSGAFESLTARFLLDGVTYVTKGARGNVQLMLDAYGIPKLKFRFTGFDTNALTNTGNNPTDYSPWQRPVVLTDANAGDIRLGGGYATGAVTGGTQYAHRGLSIDLGNKVEHMEILGGEAIDIVEREVTGKMQVSLDADTEVAWRDEITDNMLTGLGLSYGTQVGHKLAIWAPSVQRIAPQTADYKGRVMVDTDLRLLPVAGNDELIIAAL